MPLIVITGVPSSGKTTRTQELRKIFEELNKKVYIVSEIDQIVKAGFDKTCYADKDKEKHIRGLLKSEITKLMSPNDIVILDALNYIKGYRYELFCAAKANKCNQCTVHTEINRGEAWTFNELRDNDSEKYDRETFDALVMRYEDPDGKNRWDAPLFTVFPHQTLDTEGIYAALFKKKLPKPNMSTQNPPLKSTNFLYELDQITKRIVDSLVIELKSGVTGTVKVPGFEELSLDISEINIPDLMNCRRQYINYSRSHAPDPLSIPRLFIQYLATNFNSD